MYWIKAILARTPVHFLFTAAPSFAGPLAWYLAIMSAASLYVAILKFMPSPASAFFLVKNLISSVSSSSS